MSNYVDDVLKRTAALYKDWIEGMDERKDGLPDGSRRPKPEEMRTAVEMKYPPAWYEVPEIGPILISPFLLLLATNPRVKDRTKILKMITGAP